MTGTVTHVRQRWQRARELRDCATIRRMDVKRSYELTCTVNGRTYTAQRVVTGKTKLRQVVEFRGHVEQDGATYSRDHEGEMVAVARQMLWRLVTQGWPGQPALDPPADTRATPAD